MIHAQIFSQIESMNHDIQIIQDENSGHEGTLVQLPAHNSRDFLKAPFWAHKVWWESGIIAVGALTPVHRAGYGSSLTVGETQIARPEERRHYDS